MKEMEEAITSEKNKMSQNIKTPESIKTPQNTKTPESIKTSESVKNLQEITFRDFLREGNKIYKKNCEVYYKLASHYGLTETMFDILYFVRENEDCHTQAELCSNLYLRKQTVNTALKKLEKEGYIYLAKDAGNGKNKTIHFTEKGDELVKNTVDHVFEVEKKAFERLSQEERKGVLYYGLKHIEILDEETDRLIQESMELEKVKRDI